MGDLFLGEGNQNNDINITYKVRLCYINNVHPEEYPTNTSLQITPNEADLALQLRTYLRNFGNTCIN